MRTPMCRVHVSKLSRSTRAVQRQRRGNPNLLPRQSPCWLALTARGAPSKRVRGHGRRGGKNASTYLRGYRDTCNPEHQASPQRALVTTVRSTALPNMVSGGPRRRSFTRRTENCWHGILNASSVGFTTPARHAQHIGAVGRRRKHRDMVAGCCRIRSKTVSTSGIHEQAPGSRV